MAWDAALSVKKFRDYYFGAEAWREIRLSKTLLKFIVDNAKKYRIGIAGINCLPPSYPAKHSSVALAITTSRKAIEAREPKFTATFKRIGTTSGGEVVVAYDINQWNCRRTFAVNVVVKNGKDVKFLLSGDPSQQPIFKEDFNRALQGIPKGDCWEKFLARVKAKVMRHQYRGAKKSTGIDFPFPLATPAKGHPYHLEWEGRETADFNDDYSGVEYYRATHATHESYKAVAVRRKRRVLRKRANDAATARNEKVPERVPEQPSGRPRAGRSSGRLGDLDGARMRRLGQAELLEARATHLRACSLEKQARKVAYCAVAFNADFVTCESITFFAKGIPGAIGKIRQKMPKDFRAMWVKVLPWLRVQDGRVPELDPVPAPRTSQRCLAHGAEGGVADDRFSHDLWRCTKGDEIVDGHVNAAGQIGLSHWRQKGAEEDEGGG